MSPTKYAIALMFLAAAAARSAWAQPAPAAPVTLDERVTGQITPGTGLTADEVARRARGASLESVASRHDVAAAEATVDQARSGYLPRASVTARYTRLSDLEQGALGNIVAAAPGTEPGPIASGTPLFSVPLSFPTLLNSTTFQASLIVPLSDYFLRVPQSIDAARSAERAAQLASSTTGQRVETDARLAYYNWVRYRLTVPVAEQAVEQAKGHLSDVKKAFDVGSASKADVLRVESTVAQAELNVVRARNVADLTEARLRTAMRDTSGAPYAIGEDVLADLPADEGQLEPLVKQAYENRPELRGLDANVEAIRGKAKVTRAAYYPRVDLFADAQLANPNPRVFPQEDEFRGSWDVGAQLTWTPTDIPATRAQVREQHARAAALEAQRGAVADNVRLEVLAALQAVSEARAAVATATQVLTTATESYRVRRALFQNGRSTSLELSDAELDLTRARLDAINARVDLRVARARLGKAIGSGS